jgi:hypothetical protein
MRKLFLLLVFVFYGLGTAVYAYSEFEESFWPALTKVAAKIVEIHEYPSATYHHPGPKSLAKDAHLWALIVNQQQQNTHDYWVSLKNFLQQWHIELVQYLWPQESLPFLLGRLRCPDAFDLGPYATQENINLMIKALEELYKHKHHDAFWIVQFRPILRTVQDTLGTNEDWADYLLGQIEKRGSDFFAWAEVFLLASTPATRAALLQHPRIQQAIKELLLQGLKDDLMIMEFELNFYAAWDQDIDIIRELKASLHREQLAQESHPLHNPTNPPPSPSPRHPCHGWFIPSK